MAVAHCGCNGSSSHARRFRRFLIVFLDGPQALGSKNAFNTVFSLFNYSPLIRFFGVGYGQMEAYIHWALPESCFQRIFCRRQSHDPFGGNRSHWRFFVHGNVLLSVFGSEDA